MFADALQWAGLQHLAERNANELSGGERQRVALTRARILQPKLLLLDEPTSNMDSEARQQTCEMMARLKRDGVSILVSTHEIPQLIRLADIHLDLCEGHLQQQASTLAVVHKGDNIIPYISK